MAIYKNQILIVDDNADARELLIDLLASDPYELHQAGDGSAALSAVARHDPDLVLLDVMMPEVDGFEVCQRLRNNSKSADIPIILLTALHDKASRRRGFEMGADDFISKPYDRFELRTRVRGITRLNRYRRLQSEQAKLEAVVKHSQQATVIIGDDGKLQYANAAAEQLLLWHSDTPTVGEDFLQLAQRHFKLEPYMNWARWPSFQPNPSRKRYLVNRDTDSAELQWLQVDVVAHLLQDQEMGWILDIKDVTVYMAARRALWSIRTIVAERLLPPAADLVTSLDHLSTLKANQLNKKTATRIAQLSFDKARTLYERMEKVVQSSDFSKQVSGRTLPVSWLEGAVSEVVATSKIATEVQDASVAIQNHMPKSDDSVACSFEQFHTIMTELIDNAIVHHPRLTPKIEIALRRNRVDQITIIISDNGSGITADELELVWQPFYQTSDSSQYGKNLGLGLTVVSTIVWEVDGHFMLKPGPNGVGTTATVTLPIARNVTA